MTFPLQYDFYYQLSRLLLCLALNAVSERDLALLRSVHRLVTAGKGPFSYYVPADGTMLGVYLHGNPDWILSRVGDAWSESYSLLSHLAACAAPDRAKQASMAMDRRTAQSINNSKKIRDVVRTIYAIALEAVAVGDRHMMMNARQLARGANMMAIQEYHDARFMQLIACNALHKRQGRYLSAQERQCNLRSLQQLAIEHPDILGGTPGSALSVK
jgi:hypothetical protein